jgi:hypothetical protein
LILITLLASSQGRSATSVKAGQENLGVAQQRQESSVNFQVASGAGGRDRSGGILATAGAYRTMLAIQYFSIIGRKNWLVSTQARSYFFVDLTSILSSQRTALGRKLESSGR